MKQQLVKQPYCHICGAIKPEEIKTSICIPCSKRGHCYRLVANETDRLERIRHWLLFYNTNGYTTKEVKSIPWIWKYLLGRTFSEIRYKQQFMKVTK